MRRGVVCLLFGTLMWAQARMGNSSSDAPKDHQVLENTGSTAHSASTVAPDAGVITINGLCDSATKKTSPSNCKTVITRAQFETLIGYVQPNLAEGDRRLFATSYARTLIRAQQAREMGLDGGARYEAVMKLRQDVTLQLLLGDALKEKAEHVPDKDVEQYYADNREAFEEIEVEGLWVPGAQMISAAGLDPDEVQKRRQDSIVTMKKVAEGLRVRAVAGQDLSQLQAEAFKAALFGPGDPRPKIGTLKRRRQQLSKFEYSLMDLKPGEISQVFDESNGFYIYRAGAKRTLPLEEVKSEISRKLGAERLQKYQAEMEKYATATFDDNYFTGTKTTSPEEP